MFTTANGFNNTLYTGSTHIANSGEVPTYKFMGQGWKLLRLSAMMQMEITQVR